MFLLQTQSRLNEPNGEDLKVRVSKMATTIWHEVKDAVMPQEEVLSATRARSGGVTMDQSSAESPKDVVPVTKPTSRWQKMYAQFSEQVFQFC